MDTIQSLFAITEDELMNLIEQTKIRHYNLPVVEIDGDAWAFALTDEEADQAACDYIEQAVWAFNSDFLQDMTGIPQEMFEAVQDKCEGANDAITACIEATCGMESFVDNAIDADGRGHFLSCYDSQEVEFEKEDGSFGYAYRIN